MNTSRFAPAVSKISRSNKKARRNFDDEMYKWCQRLDIFLLNIMEFRAIATERPPTSALLCVVAGAIAVDNFGRAKIIGQ